MADDQNVQLGVSLDDQASAPLQQIADNMEKLGSTTTDSMNTAGEATSGWFDSTIAGSVAAGEAILNLGESIIGSLEGAIEAVSGIQELTVSLTYLTGSSENAQLAIQGLSEFAQNSPFEMPSVEEAARRLITVGVTAQNLEPTLNMLGNVAAALGGNLSDSLNRLVNYYGMAEQAGEVTTKSLMQRVGQINPLLLVLQGYYHTTTTAVQEMAKNHQISLEDMNKAFLQSTTEGGRFAGAMVMQEQTLGGALTRLKNVFIDVQENGLKPLADALGKLIYQLTNDLIVAFKIVEAAISMLSKAWETHRDLLLIVIASIGGALVGAFAAATAAVISFTVAAIPSLGLFVVAGFALGAVAVLIYEIFKTNFGGLADMLRQWGTWATDFFGGVINSFISKLNDLISIYNTVAIVLGKPIIPNIKPVDLKAVLGDAWKGVTDAMGAGMDWLNSQKQVVMGQLNLAQLGGGAGGDTTGGSGSTEKTAEQKAADKQATADAAALTKHLADLSSDIKADVNLQEKNRVQMEKFQTDLYSAQQAGDKAAAAEAQNQIDQLKASNSDLQDKIDKNTGYLQQSGDARAVQDLQDIKTLEDNIAATDDNRQTTQDLKDALQNDKQNPSGSSSRSTASVPVVTPSSASTATTVVPVAVVDSSAPIVVTPVDSSGTPPAAVTPISTTQSGVVVMLDNGSTATKNYYFQIDISGNNLLGTDANGMASQIGDAILKYLQPHLSYASI